MCYCSTFEVHHRYPNAVIINTATNKEREITLVFVFSISEIYSFSVFYEFLIVIKTISGGEIDKLFGTNIKNLIKMFLFFCSSLNWCKKLRITIALCFTGKPQTCFYQTWSYSSSSSETKTIQETSVRLLIWIGFSVP